jgi:hypothetical protein
MTTHPRQYTYRPKQYRANLDFLKTFTSAEIWKNAPPSVRKTPTEVFDKTYHRQPPGTQQQTHTSSLSPQTSSGPPKQYTASNGQQPPYKQQNPNANAPARHQDDQTTAQPRFDDATIETSASSASRTTSFFSAQTNRFQELEAQIKLNQQSYEVANSKIDTIQEQVMITMEACATSAHQINEMRQKLNECASAQQVTALTTQVQELTTAMTALLKLKLPHSVEKDSNQRTDTSDQQDRHERMDIPFQDYGDKQKVKRSLTQVSTDGSQVMPASTQPHELPRRNPTLG